MDATSNLNLPFIIAAQAQKHVTHNEALRTLDVVVQLSVLDKDLDTPPGSPAHGDAYIVAASATGDWSGQDGNIAAWHDGAWAFYAQREGWLTWVADEDEFYVWSGAAWEVFAGGGGGGLANVVEDTTPQLGGALDANGHGIGFDDGTGLTDDSGNEQIVLHKTASAVNQIGITNAATGNAPQVAAEGADTNIDLTLAGKGTGHPKAALFGVNATADSVTKFAVAAEASLFNHVGNGHQHKINKAAAGDTASLLFQTATSGRAEMGLAGDDNFHFKVSADGMAWLEAMVIDRATGAVSFPLTPRRENLTTSRTYYVRADGSDSNTGLVNNSGGAWLTIQHALDVLASTLDFGGQQVIIQVGTGTYGQIIVPPFVGQGTLPLNITGDLTTPSNVVLTNAVSAGITVQANQGAFVRVEGVRLSATNGGGGFGLFAQRGAHIQVGTIDFGTCTSAQIQSEGLVSLVGSITISGDATNHLVATAGGSINYFTGSAFTVTASGTRTFTAFAAARQAANIQSFSMTPSGTFVGARYAAVLNSVIQTFGGGASYFPGNAIGSSATGGQYA